MFGYQLGNKNASVVQSRKLIEFLVFGGARGRKLASMAMNNLFLDPKRLLRVDAVGASISFILLALILPEFESVIGIPKLVLWTLAVPPIFFLFFDLYALLRLKENFAKALGTIAILNILYCITSLVIAFLHLTEIRPLGWLYICGEIIIVLFLARYEWKVATSMNR